jgi:hypothetical protein
MSTKDLTKNLGTICFDDGVLGFRLSKKGGEHRIGDHLLFYPCIDIYKYSVSDTNERFLKHILYDLYEFTFMAIDKYEHEDDDEDEEYDRKKDVYHYLIEILPGFNVFHFNWLKKTDEYLKINTLYHGFGRLSNYGDPVFDNPDTVPEVMKRIRCEGTLEKIQINEIWRDCHKYFPPTEEDMNVDDDEVGVIFYEDILEKIGYPGDMLKFRGYVSKYQDDQSSLESTGQNKDSGTLVYTIRMA